MPLVSFVVPTLGRDTLSRALESLDAQTDTDWDAYVVCDGWERHFASTDDQDLTDSLKFFWIGGEDYGSAGMTRNVGIEAIEQSAFDSSEWIAFLDDDDVLGSTYVEHLRQHAEDHPLAEVIVFRMDHPGYGIIPGPDGRLAYARVGISFAVKADLGCRFVAEDVSRAYHEDWEMISRFIQEGRNIFVSPHTEYIVRNHTNA